MPAKKKSRPARQTRTAKPAAKRTAAAKRKVRTPGPKYVYAFDEIRAAQRAAGTWDGVRGLLGGKGANLAEMTQLGLPVPPGFTVTTEACNTFLAAGGRFPAGMWDQVLDAV